MRSIALLLIAIPGWGANRALLVGIGNYPQQQHRLKGTTEDLRRMRAVALKLGYLETDIKVLQDSQATLQAITTSIEEWLIKGTDPGDYALFYYTGHGAQIPDQVPLDEADGKDEVLVPFDFKLVAHPQPGQPNLRNVLVDDDLNGLLRRIRSRHLTVILDACFSGGGLKGSPPPNALPKYLPGGRPELPPNGSKAFSNDDTGQWSVPPDENFGALLAAKEDEQAFDTPGGGLLTIAFSRAVLGLSRAASLDLLYQPISSEVATFHFNQHPTLGGTREALSRGLFVDRGDGRSALRRPPQPAPVQVSRLYREAQHFMQSAPRYADIRAQKTELRPGEDLVLTCIAPADGHLYILNIAENAETADILYPNSIHVENHVHKGDVIRVPDGEFSVRARISGADAVERDLVIAVFSSAPMNVSEGEWKRFFQRYTSPFSREDERRGARQELLAVGSVLTTIRR
jgi:hypothetical protein